MFFLIRRFNWDNRDYRDYCAHRARLKRRLRMSIGLTLMVCMVVIVGLGSQH